MKVFVFGSNLAGRHGRGAALDARLSHGAVYGQGVGFQGESYAIPTMDEHLHPLPIERIAEYVTEFLAFALAHPRYDFEVTPIGCGLAGFSPAQIAPLFTAEPLPENVHLPAAFLYYDPHEIN